MEAATPIHAAAAAAPSHRSSPDNNNNGNNNNRSPLKWPTTTTTTTTELSQRHHHHHHHTPGASAGAAGNNNTFNTPESISSGGESEDVVESAPPPVIFAGVPSPGGNTHASLRRPRRSNLFVSKRASLRSRRIKHRRSTTGDDESSESIEPAAAVATSSSQVPADDSERNGCRHQTSSSRLTIRRTSTGISSSSSNHRGHHHRGHHHRGGQSADPHLSELQAALDHSKAREVLLLESVEKLKGELDEKSRCIDERHKLLETMEKEHRRMKSSFRDLMDVTLDAPLDAINHHDDDDKNNQNNNSDDVEMTVSLTPVASRASRASVGVVTSSERIVCTTENHSSSSSSSSSSCSENRAQSVPPRVVNNATADVFDLRRQLRHTTELLESLKGTNGYAQQVLQRNSDLEELCSQLQSGNEKALRELHDELSRARRHRSEAQAKAVTAERQAATLTDDVAALHEELRRLHERQKHQKLLDQDLAAARNEIEILRDSIITRDEEAKRLAGQVAAEMKHLKEELDMMRNLRMVTTTSDGPAGPAGGRAGDIEKYVLQITELEKLLTEERLRYEESNRSLTEETSQLRSANRRLATQMEAAQRRSSEAEARLDASEQTGRELREQLSSMKQRLQEELQSKNESECPEHLSQIRELQERLNGESLMVKTQSDQICRQLENIKFGNEKFKELAERNDVLNHLLQKQQKDKEKIVADNLKTSEKLFEQADNYRRRCEQARDALSLLKVKLDEADEVRSSELQAAQVAKLKEIKALKEQFSDTRRTDTNRYETQLASIRTKYEKDASDARKERQDKISSLATQYEQVIDEMKLLHEKKLSDNQISRDAAVTRLREEHAAATAAVHASLQDQLAAEREMHQKEFEATTASYRTNFQNHLKKKTDENRKLQHELEEIKASLELTTITSSQRISDLEAQLTAALKHHHHRGAGESPGIGDGADHHQMARRLKDETDRREAAEKTVETMKAKHIQAISTLERKVSLSADQSVTLEKENAELVKRCARLAADLTSAEFQYKQAVDALDEKLKDVMDRMALEKHSLQASSDVCGSCSRADSEARHAATTLMERLEQATMTIKQLEGRIEQETTLLKAEVDSKNERIKSLVMTSDHINDLMEKNASLEALVESDKQEYQRLLDEQAKHIGALEGKVSTTSRALQRALADFESARHDLDASVRNEKNTMTQLKNLTNRIDSTEALESQVEGLTTELEKVRGQLNEATRQQQPSSSSSSAVLQSQRLATLKQLSDELTAARRDYDVVVDEVENLRRRVQDTSKLKLEIDLLQNSVDSRNQRIDSLKAKLDAKQTVINELTESLRTLDDQANSPTSSSSSSAQQQQPAIRDGLLAEMTNRLEMLQDERHIFEQERRTMAHRSELEKQMMSQSLEQKERQLQQLLDTNKRAEKLFARNAELEELLLTLTNELESVQVTSKTSSSSSSTSATRITTTAANDDSTTSKDDDMSSKEIAELNARVIFQQTEIEKLRRSLSEVRVFHAKEIELLQDRLRAAALDHNNDDNAFMKNMSQKFEEFQKEVTRQREERESIASLLAERDAVISTARQNSGTNEHSAVFMAEIAVLTTAVDTLTREKSSLQRRVQEMLSQFTSTSSDTESIQRRNKELEASVDSLTRTIHEQRATLDQLNAHADRALSHNSAMLKSTAKMSTQLDGARWVDVIIQRNTELENLLKEIQDESSRLSTPDITETTKRKKVTTTSSSRFSETASSLGDRLANAWTKVDKFLDSGHHPAASTSTSSTAAPFTPSLSPDASTSSSSSPALRLTSSSLLSSSSSSSTTPMSPNLSSFSLENRRVTSSSSLSKVATPANAEPDRKLKRQRINPPPIINTRQQQKARSLPGGTTIEE